MTEHSYSDIDMTERFQIKKAGEKTPVFVGSREVAERCFETLRTSFFFVAGNAKPITDEFPYTLEPT